MTEDDLRTEGAISYTYDILESLEQMIEVSNSKESATINKVISTIEIMMAMDFRPEKLDS